MNDNFYDIIEKFEEKFDTKLLDSFSTDELYEFFNTWVGDIGDQDEDEDGSEYYIIGLFKDWLSHLYDRILNNSIPKKYGFLLLPSKKYSSVCNKALKEELKTISKKYWLYSQYDDMMQFLTNFNIELLDWIIYYTESVTFKKINNFFRSFFDNFLTLPNIRKKSKISTILSFFMEQSEEFKTLIFESNINVFESDDVNKKLKDINPLFDNFLDEMYGQYTIEDSHIDDDLLLNLEKMERNNRIKKVLYNGESRIKGNIYPDTIQQMIDNITKGSMKYSEPVEVTIPSKEVTLPDGTKIMTKPKTQLQGKKLLPMDDHTQKQIDILKGLLAKSQQKNHIKIDDISITKTQKDRDIFNVIGEFIRKNGKFSFGIQVSKYTNTDMQTLINNTSNHNVFLFYLKNFNELISLLIDNIRLPNVSSYIKNLKNFSNNGDGVHQGQFGLDNLLLGFVRYHYEDKSIFVNTIQSLISKAMEVENDDLYNYIVKIVFQHFIKQMHKKGYTQIVLPTSQTREHLFGSESFVSAYDSLPKMLGFEKGKITDTIWLDKKRQYDQDNDPNIEFYNEVRELSKGNYWILNGLNENKKIKRQDFTQRLNS